MNSLQPVGRRFFLYNTVCEIVLWDYCEDPGEVLDECEEAAIEVQRLLNAYDESSELGRMNRMHRPTVPYSISPSLFRVLEQIHSFSEISHGAFDPTVRPLINLWNFTSSHPVVPEQDSIEKALSHCGYRNILLDERNLTVTFLADGMMLDAGGMGKGYAVKKVKEKLQERRIKSASINFGGEMGFLGEWHHGGGVTEWNVQIQAPNKERGISLGKLKLSDCAIATSGDYDRFFIDKGRRYCHILDPRTGYPVSNGLRSVTIVCDDPVKAELISTAVFVLGAKDGGELARDNEAEFVMIDDPGLWISEGLKECFQAVT